MLPKKLRLHRSSHDTMLLNLIYRVSSNSIFQHLFTFDRFEKRLSLLDVIITIILLFSMTFQRREFNIDGH